MNRGFTLLCSVILILAGCSGGDDDQARTVPEPTSSASPSSSATEWSEAPSTGEESPVAMTEEESPAATTEEQPSAELDSIVLTLDDMPSGWTTDPELASDDDDSSTGAAFCGVEDADLNVDGTGGESVDAAFKQSDFGPFVLNSVALAPTSEAASEAMDVMLDAASQCTEWTETDAEGAETTYAISPLSFDNVGDDTIAFRISADADGLGLTIDMVMWHRGPMVSLVALLGIGGTDAEILTDLIETVASRM